MNADWSDVCIGLKRKEMLGSIGKQSDARPVPHNCLQMQATSWVQTNLIDAIKWLEPKCWDLFHVKQTVTQYAMLIRFLKQTAGDTRSKCMQCNAEKKWRNPHRESRDHWPLPMTKKAGFGYKTVGVSTRPFISEIHSLMIISREVPDDEGRYLERYVF